MDREEPYLQRERYSHWLSAFKCRDGQNISTSNALELASLQHKPHSIAIRFRRYYELVQLASLAYHGLHRFLHCIFYPSELYPASMICASSVAPGRRYGR